MCSCHYWCKCRTSGIDAVIEPIINGVWFYVPQSMEKIRENMITCGMVGNSLDASSAVFDNDKLLWASMAKDFPGVHNDPDQLTQIEVAR